MGHWKSSIVILFLVGMVMGYNASVEPNISSSANDVANELHNSLSSTQASPSVFSGWSILIVGLFILMVVIAFGLWILGASR